jgi:hypothetical protein
MPHMHQLTYMSGKSSRLALKSLSGGREAREAKDKMTRGCNQHPWSRETAELARAHFLKLYFGANIFAIKETPQRHTLGHDTFARETKIRRDFCAKK